MNQLVKRFIKRIGLWGNGNVIRKFRKTYISLGYLSGADYPTLGRAVGHKKITTTAKYYTYFDTKKQKEELNKIKILDKIKKVKEGEEIFAENVENQSLDKNLIL